jgi:DNA-binding XRE family transcriptional regulator
MIRHHRIVAGLSQRAFAKKMGVTQACISCWETGKSEPPLRALRKMARIFAVHVSSLLGGARQAA